MTDNINSFEVVEYLEEARSRVTDQFKDKPVFDKFVQLMLSNNINIQLALKDLMQKRSIDTAEGVQLDILGDIVGQPRVLLSTDLIRYFAFQGSPEAQGFGSTDNPTVGGLFYSFGDPLSGNTLLNDAQYRLFIRAKIMKNITTATTEEMISFIRFVFGAVVVAISQGNAEFTLLVGRELTSFERLLLTYTSNIDGYDAPFLPKPVGVRVNLGQFDGDNFFAFQGVPNAQGFGDFTGDYGYGVGYGLNYGESNVSVQSGGKFATIF
jgi:hypothetical protein